MAALGQRKKSEAERRRIAERYLAWRHNSPKRICNEHGINRKTVIEYAREFGAVL